MALRPLLIGEILDSGVREFRRHFGVYVRIVAPAALAYNIVTATIRLATIPSEGDLFVGSLAAVRGASVVSGLLGLVVFTVFGGAVVHAVGGSLVGRVPNAGASIRAAVGRLMPLIALVLMWGAAVAAASLTAVGWIVPLTGFSIAVPVCVLERRGPLASLGRSWALTIRRFWPTLGTILAGGLFVSMFVYIWVIVYVVSDQSVHSRSAYVVGTIVTGISNLIVATLFVPLIGAWQAAVYTDLCIRQEGLDLAIALENVHADAPNGSLGLLFPHAVAPLGRASALATPSDRRGGAPIPTGTRAAQAAAVGAASRGRSGEDDHADPITPRPVTDRRRPPWANS